MNPVQVLLAEDNRGDVILVREALREYKVDHALRLVEDGDQAMRHIDSIGGPTDVPCPDIFLLDLNIPRGSGHELLEKFRLCCPDTPVVIITSSDAPSDIARAHQLGASRYFRKPSNLEEFLQLGALVKELVGSAADSR